MKIDFSSSAVQDRLITIGVIAGFVLVLAAVAGVGLYLTRGPDCARFWSVPDPQLMIVVYIGELDEQGTIDLNDPVSGYGWVYENRDLKFYIESQGQTIFAQPCFHDEGIDWNNIEVVPAAP